MGDLSLSLLSRISLVGSAEAGRAFLGHVETLHPDWLPEHWGHHHTELLHHRHEPGGPTDEMWEDDLYWRSRDGAEGSALLLYEVEPHAHLDIDADSARVDMAGAIGLFKRLAAEFEGDYGYLHKLTRDDVAFVQGSLAAAYVDERGPQLGVPITQLELCLPDLFWANVLGPPYTELFGAERLATAPAHVVEEIAPGTFYLQLSERIEDIHEHPERLERVRVDIKEHLGVNAFWHPEAGLDFAYYQAPRFPDEDEPPERGAGGSAVERPVRDLSFSLHSRTSLVASAADGRAFLDHLEALHPGWMPARWGHYEPLRHRHEQGGPTDEMWGADLFWKARDKATGDAAVRDGKTHAYLAIDAESRRVDIDGAVTLLKRLAAEFGGDYGYIHKVTREDEAFLQGSLTSAGFDEDGPYLVVPTVQLELCLPDLFWANVLGPPYTQMFGADRLATAPAHLVEEIAPGTFYLQLSERIEDIHEHPDQLDRARVEIEKHLGPNAFWHPDKPARPPLPSPPLPHPRPTTPPARRARRRPVMPVGTRAGACRHPGPPRRATPCATAPDRPRPSFG